MATLARVFRWARIAIGLGVVLVALLLVLFTRDRKPAVSAELSPLETRLLGQNRWLRGGPAALRVITTDHRSGAPVRASVKLSLARAIDGKPTGTPVVLFDGKTNALGTLEAGFTAPDDVPGSYQLTAAVKSPLGEETLTQPIQLDESVQVMLTTDKPLYQPGQTIHLRALALDLATRKAVSGQRLTFEIEDARGNKVYKHAQKLSKFGLAGADFVLANEVNMGAFTVRALLPRGQAEKKVRVERYVLPKFKVALTTEKAYYLPGETVQGTVQADYFFGKPVAGSAVTIAVSTTDIGVSKLAELSGKTDAQGTYKFEYVLPMAFVGQAFEQGKAVVEFHGTVKDTADHAQEVFTSKPVVETPIQLVIVPESRVLVPGVSNRIFLAAATPDGTPLPNMELAISTSLTRTIFTQTTDVLGLATFDLIPGHEPVTLTVRARTAGGERVIVTRTLSAAPAAEGIILRSSKSLAKVGDRLTVNALSSTRGGTIYLDVIRNKQTILTRALPVKDEIASLPLNITADMTGTVELHAYKILTNEEIIRDTRVLIVTPADDLVIDVTADKETYRPGEDAKLNFQVRDQQQHPILAALGLAIVDESVFALSELQPGLEKIYFTLEKELMEPKYEIHGLTPADVVLDEKPMPVPAAQREEARQRAAAVLFAAAPGQGDFDLRVNSYQQRYEKLREKVMDEMGKAQQRISNAVEKYRRKTGKLLGVDEGLFTLVRHGYLKSRDLRDHWGNFFKTNTYGNMAYGWFALMSAGLDGKWNTADDLTVGGEMAFDNKWGGAGDMVFARRAMPAMAPAPMAEAGALNDPAGMKMQHAPATTPSTATAAPVAAAPVRIREYFPETMYWNPALITDERGMAELTVPMADSITTWRLSMTANSARGQLGSATAPLRVFQDFFVDIDLPVALTQHDRVEIPVAVYNYLPAAQTVKLTLEPADWFTLEGDSVKTVEMDQDAVKVVYFPITVRKIGRFPLTVHADGAKLSDAIRRSIDILPNGQEFRPTVNDRLEGKVAKTVTIPAGAIDGASTIWVKLYPGAFSQVVEGLDGLLRMPNGCFEQTSSTTFPNVLVLSYLKQTKKINPELQMKAEQYINVGYQRLVTFECKQGGFSWFGDEPANQVLTAYGLLEFSDMAKVHEVDPALISRTQQWLAARQKADGTWPEDKGGIAEGIINRQTGALRTAAYLAWALAESGYQGAQVQRAVSYVKAHRGEAKDPYTLAVMLNLLTRVERNGDSAANVANALIEQATATDKTAYWQADTQTFTGANSKGADLETTGLAAFGLAKWGRNTGFTNKVLTHLIQSKDSFGTWESTQGTVWALKALLYAGGHASGGGKGTVTVAINGHTAKTFAITPEDSDVMRQVDLGEQVREGTNAVTLHYQGDGSLLYQIVGRYYLPWDAVTKLPTAQAPMSIAVQYDKTLLAQDDTATVTVTIKNLTRATVEMPLIDVGVPPGFTVQPNKLEDAVEAKKISRYTIAARQIIIYLDKLAPGQSVALTYQLKAKYPIKARTPDSKAYPYYNPERTAISAPQQITVK